MNPRDSSCAYQWYSDIFSSPQAGFGAEIIGTDGLGFPFKRIQADYFIPPREYFCLLKIQIPSLRSLYNLSWNCTIFHQLIEWNYQYRQELRSYYERRDWNNGKHLYARQLSPLLQNSIYTILSLITDCQNGGSVNGYGGCTCPPTWTGLDCSVPICLNGGTLDMTVCNCAVGYYGINCQASECILLLCFSV